MDDNDLGEEVDEELVAWRKKQEEEGREGVGEGGEKMDEDDKDAVSDHTEGGDGQDEEIVDEEVDVNGDAGPSVQTNPDGQQEGQDELLLGPDGY